jgi:hypothetical protein
MALACGARILAQQVSRVRIEASGSKRPRWGRSTRHVEDNKNLGYAEGGGKCRLAWGPRAALYLSQVNQRSSV